MIRELTDLKSENQQQLERLGRLFVEESGSGTQFNFEHFLKMTGPAMEMGLVKIWVMERNGVIVGLLGGLVSKLFFVDELIAVEMFWFVDKENRGSLEAIRLLEHFEQWTVSVGARYVNLAYMEKIHPAKMAEFFVKRGFEKYETIYRRKIWQ